MNYMAVSEERTIGHGEVVLSDPSWAARSHWNFLREVVISVILLWFNISLAFPGAAKPGAPAEGLGLVGTLFGLGSLGGELGACFLPSLGEGRQRLGPMRYSVNSKPEPAKVI